MTVINIRGTSGSGKSTIVRHVMGLYPERVENFVEGRRQPISYNCLPPEGPTLVVLGHYATPCGGTDTITKTDDVYALVRSAAGEGHHVLYEGIMVSDDVSRCVGLHRDKIPLMVIGLTTPIEICLAGIQARRDARGDVRPLNPDNTIARAKRHKRAVERLRASGVDTKMLGREDALAAVLRALGLTPE